MQLVSHGQSRQSGGFPIAAPERASEGLQGFNKFERVAM